MKICTKCKQSKTLACFNRDQCKKDGLQAWCKTCKAQGMIAYHKQHPEKRWCVTHYDKNKKNNL